MLFYLGYQTGTTCYEKTPYKECGGYGMLHLKYLKKKSMDLRNYK